MSNYSTSLQEQREKEQAGFVKMVRRVIGGVTLLFALLMVSCGAGSMIENVDADEIAVIQSPMSGQLTIYTDAGMKWQGWGKVTKYKKRTNLWFQASKEQADVDESVKVRFNDGGHATISGSIAWEMPIDREHLIQLHTKYGSQDAIEHQLVKTIVEKSIYMTGPLMSSKESYAERRNELIRFIEDQIQNGVYQTRTEEIKENDPITGQPKTVSVVRLVEHGGKFLRQDKSPLAEFGVKTFNLSLKSVDYDKTVEGQIQQQQQAIMQVQTAVAEAKKAEQRAITVEQEGKANAAQAKWAQEVEKAKAVTAAEQQRDVAKLAVESAQAYKQEQILKAEADSTYRRTMMAADGALQQKLAAYQYVNEKWADALAKYQGSIVPSTMLGGASSSSTNGFGSFMEMITAKTARDLALDATPKGQ